MVTIPIINFLGRDEAELSEYSELSEFSNVYTMYCIQYTNIRSRTYVLCSRRTPHDAKYLYFRELQNSCVKELQKQLRFAGPQELHFVDKRAAFSWVRRGSCKTLFDGERSCVEAVSWQLRLKI